MRRRHPFSQIIWQQRGRSTRNSKTTIGRQQRALSRSKALLRKNILETIGSRSSRSQARAKAKSLGKYPRPLKPRSPSLYHIQLTRSPWGRKACKFLSTLEVTRRIFQRRSSNPLWASSTPLSKSKPMLTPSQQFLAGALRSTSGLYTQTALQSDQFTNHSSLGERASGCLHQNRTDR
jgi:hypothetical protein